MNERPPTTTEPEDHLGMTDEQWAWFQSYTHGFGEQDENGVDVSLLRENLRLTPSQRMEKLLRGPGFAWSGRVMESPPDFRQLLLALQHRKVRWVLIGGVAMRCHGSQVSTDDLDLCYARDDGNLAALAEALAPFHPRLRGAPEGLPFVLDARTLHSGANFTLATDAADIDLLGDVPGEDSFEALWDRASEMELHGIPVRVASLDDLIAMKRAAGRPRDQLHLLELERLRRLAGDAEQVNRGNATNTDKADLRESE